MRIPLVGPANAFADPADAAAASECINLYPEAIGVPQDRAKNTAILRKRAGAHAMIDLGGAEPRGFWSGGGRLFVVAANNLYEIEQGTYTPGNPSTGAATIKAGYPKALTVPWNSEPAIMFANGAQLGIIANGKFYYDNGAGPVEARFLLEGAGTVAGTTLTQTAGNDFTADMVGRAIKVNEEWRTVSAYTDATHVTLSSTVAGVRTGFVTMWYEGQVYQESGDDFTPGMVGKPIVIGSKTYTVKAVFTTSAMQLVETDNAAVTTGAAYSTLSATMQWECDGGAVVTAASGAYLSGSAFVQRPKGGTPDLGRQVAYSDPFDFTRWRGLNFFSKEGGPDYIQSIHADRDVLIVLGTKESELWQMDPATGSPVRLPNATANEGSVSRYAPQSFANSFFFLGGSPNGQTIAYKLNGFTPVRISTSEVEEAWSNVGNFVPSAVGSHFTNSRGHQFWVIRFPAPVWSWAYDVTASEQLGYPVWHRLIGWSTFTGDFWEYPYWHHTFVPEWGTKGMHIVGGYGSKIYELSDDYGDDDGTDIHWRRCVPYRYNDGKRLFFGRHDLQATGSNPIARDYSDDNAATWSTPQNEIGNGTTRRYWPTGGSCNSAGRIWRFSGASQDKVTLIDLQADESPGSV